MYFFRFVCLIACATASPIIQQNGDEIKLEKKILQPPQKVQDGTRWYSQYLPVGSKGHLVDSANAIQPNIVKFKIISEVIDKTISIMDSSPIYFDNILVDSQQNRKYFYDKVEDQQDNKDCHRKKYGPEQSVKISDKINENQQPDSTKIERFSARPVLSVEEAQPVVHLNIPAPPSITSSVTLPSGYSSLSSLQNDESLIVEKVKKHKTSNNGDSRDSVSYPDTVEVSKQVPINEKQPTVRMNVPAPPSLTDSITLPSRYSSLSSLRNDERLIIEKVKEYKTSHKGNGGGSVVFSNDEEKSYPNTVEVGNQQPIINEEQRTVTLNVPAPPSIAQTITLPSGYSSLSELRNSKKALIENIHATRRYEPKQVVEFTSESQQPDITRTEIITEEPIVTEEVQPAVRLNVPAPPSITDSIALPLGYSSLSSLQNDERLIIEKVKKYKTSNKGNGEGSVVLSNDEEKSYPNTVEVGNQQPIINEEQRTVTLNVPAPPSIAQTLTLPSGYSSLSELRNSKKALIENIHATRRYEPKQVVEFTSESQQPDITRTEIITEEPIVTEEVQPAVRLNVPAPPSITDSIALPLGYSSLSSLRNNERLIIEKVKKYKTSNKGNGEGSVVLSNDEEKSYPNTVEVGNQQPIINEEQRTVTLNVPAPPSIAQTLTLPSGYSSLSELRNSKKALIENIHATRRYEPKQVVEFTSESQQPDITRTEIITEEPIVNEEEVQPAVRLNVPAVRLNVPAPPSITDSIILPSGYSSLSSLRNDERLIIERVKEYKTSDKGNGEGSIVLSNEEEKSHPVAVEIDDKPVINEEKPDITRTEIITEEPIVTREEVQPAVRLNVPAPPSITDSIILPSGYSSLSSLRNDERLIIEKVKEYKTSNKGKGGASVVLSNEEEKSFPDAVEVDNQQPKINEEQRTFMLNFNARKRYEPKQIVEYTSESQKPDITKTEVTVEQPVVTEEEAQPAVRLNIPAPPSIADSIILPSGYSSLSSLRNDERLIIKKVKEYKKSKKEEETSYSEAVKVGNQQPVINEEQRNVPAPPSIAQTITLPSGYSSLSELRNSKNALIETIHERRRFEPQQVVEFTSESQQPDITRTEINTEEPVVTEIEVQPAMRLNVPAPPSIADSITLPSGYSSLSSLRNDETLIIKKIKENKVSNNENGQKRIILVNKDGESTPRNEEVIDEKPVLSEKLRTSKNVPAQWESVINEKHEDNVESPKYGEIILEEISKKTVQEPEAPLEYPTDRESANEKVEEIVKESVIIVEEKQPVKWVVPVPPSLENKVNTLNGFASLTGLHKGRKVLLDKINGNRANGRRFIVTKSDDDVAKPVAVKFNIPAPPTLSH